MNIIKDSQMKNMFSTKFEVLTNDVDMFKEIKISALFAFMVETAFKHVKSYGLGHETEESENIWVLSTMELEVYEKIKWQDIIEVKTWPRLQEGLFFYRDFEIISEAGETLAVASSSWLFINKNLRLPDRKALRELDIKCLDKSVLSRNPKRMTAIENTKQIEKFKANYNNFDFHQHVNNSVYIDWIFNTYSKEYHIANKLTSIQIDFIQEITNMEEVSILKFDTENLHYFEGKLLETDKTCFRALLKWK
ncbi:MAG: hypothetical protein GX879_08945 [Bacteroidales bacterium]|nr:hypothetical protein [Bacteroidales bacterium]